MEDLEKVRVEPPVFVSEDDDDLAFDLRPNINIVIPSTKEPSESPMFTSPPTFLTQDSETLLQELRSIFGQEISMKIQSRHSPLSMAYNWILYQDQYVKSNSNVLTVQRFMLAAFYFSTGGRRATKSWDQCSAVPENTQEDENMDPDLPIRCVFEGGQSVCASLDEFLECPEYYRDWQKPPITPKKRWLSNSFECDWYGISCNANGEVYKISLPNNGLEGSLIPEITALEKLTNINLDHNAIGGPLPSLNKLDIHELSLAWNNFVGRLELSDQWQNLERLVLGDGNNINISMSQKFGLISRLRFLDLSGNHINSGLPDQPTYNWGVLTDLRLANCELGGNLPQGLIGLTSLVSFEAQNNRLTGTLPSALWSLAKLQKLRLDYNQFHGTLSPEIGNLIDLRELSIVSIGVTGILPSELSKLRNLESVSLQHNVFESEVPDAMCNQMSKLHTLQADCGWAGFLCACCTLCCEAFVMDPNKCHSQ